MDLETQKIAADKAMKIMQLTPEDLKKTERIPLYHYDGVLWPTFPTFRTKGIEKGITDVVNFQTRNTDSLICTYSKSGTHWIYEITKMLLENSSTLDKDSKVNTMLEAVPDLSLLEEMSSPRLLDTHFMFKYIPKKHVENRNKIIHMVRNPKDVLVSLYYHSQKDTSLNLDVPFEEFFDIWMSGEIPYGSWYEYELGMEQAEKGYQGMIYTCYYEDMKTYPEREIKKLAEYLEVQCTDELVKSIAKETSFKNMKKNKFDVSALFDEEGKGFIYRKGEIGDWKNHFTVAQNERFNAQYEEKMKNSQYKFKFE